MATTLTQEFTAKFAILPAEKQKKAIKYVEKLAKEEKVENQETMWEMIEDLADRVPAEAWEDLPTDSSINVDHYLYGHEKKSK